MAESILKLRVESSEYDNKIKRAAEGLQRYADGCRKAGGTLTQLDDGVLEFTRSLGQMETVSKSAKGSIAEMTKTFTDLSVIYNKLTDEEKNAPFGQALSSSLDQLKGRIQSGNEEIKNIRESLNGGGSLKDALNQVAGKFGLNVDILTKYGAVLGATSAALKVAKDAFMQSESNIDEWGRTIKGAEGAYDIFLQTLNNGNWSNFFSNLSQAITGARDLYDAFDRLNSIKANNAVAIAMVQAEIQQLRVLKQQGQNVDDKIKDATKRLASLQSQSANAGINAGRGQVVNTLRNGVNSIGGATINNATLNRVADNISKQGQAYFDYMKRRAADLEKRGMVTKTQTINDSQGGTYERQYKVFDINALSKEQQKQYAIAKTVTERETEIQKGLSVWSQSVQEQAAATREQFRDNRYALQGSGGKGGSGDHITIKTEEQLNNEQINKLTQEYIKATDDRRKAIEAEIKGLQQRNEEIKKLTDIAQGKVAPEGSLNALNEELKKLQTERGKLTDPIDIEIQDQQIKEVQDEIDRLNGKKVTVDIEANIPDLRTPFERLQDSIKLELSAKNIDVDKNALKSLTEVVTKYDIQTGAVDMSKVMAQTEQLTQAGMSAGEAYSKALENAIAQTIDLSTIQQRIGDEIDIPDETWQALQDQINEKLAELNIKPIKIDFSTGNIKKQSKEMSKDWNAAAQAVQAVGSAMASIEDPATKVVGTIAQAIASIALGYATATTQAATLGPWAWVAFAATGMAQMVSMISAIHSATGYAQGGMIKGNSYSGDNIGGLVDGSQLVGLNAGEVVLNASQQSMLANNLQGGGGGKMEIVGVLTGENVVLMADRWGRRTGRGELLFGKNL